MNSLDNTNLDASKTIKFNIANEELKSMVNKKTLLATLFGAGSAIAFVSAKDLANNEAPSDPATEQTNIADDQDSDYSAEVVMNEEVAQVADSMSFGEAFAEQRTMQGPGGLFEYKGKYYNTYHKEEWDAMSQSEKDDYYASVEDKIDFGSSHLVNKQTGSKIEINIDDDAQPEIILSDIDNDGIMDVESVDLNNDGNIDVVHVDKIESKNIASDAEVIDMEEDLGDFEDEFPEELIVEPSEAIEEEVSSFVIDGEEVGDIATGDFEDMEDEFSFDFEEEFGDIADPTGEDAVLPENEDVALDEGDLADPNADESFVEDGDLEDPSDIAFIEEGDISDPSMTVDASLEEGDLADPTNSDVVLIEDGDLVDPSIEEVTLEDGDLVDPSEMTEEDSTDILSADEDDAMGMVDNIDLSEFDF